MVFSRPRFGVLILVVMRLVATSSAAESDVLLQFYMDQVNLWNQQGQYGKLQAALLPGLQAFCGKSVNFVVCGINTTGDVDFTTSNIVISPGYPRNFNCRYLDVRIKISYLAGAGDITLPKAVVTEITQNQRDQVSSQVGFHLFYINDIMYLPPPPTMANKVLVPLFVLSTLVLIIVALALRNANERKRRKNLHKRLDNEMMQPQQSKNSRLGNKVGASTTDLEGGGASEKKAKTDRKSDPPDDGSRKNKKKKKKSGGHGGDARAAGKGGAKKGAKGEFNNIGFDKSINEGDPRNRGNGDGGSDSSGGNPRASQSALSEVIQVRGDSSEAGDKKSKKSPAAVRARGKHPSNSGDGAPDKNKSLSMSNSKKDAEEVMLIDEGVFKPPEANVAPDDQSGSDIDDVPTLNDSSDQQMI